MSRTEQEWGYCSSCMKNIPHFRATSPILVRTLDRLNVNALKLLNIGPWYCAHCESKSFLLKNEIESALRHDPAESLAAESELNSAKEPEQAEPIGNFLKGEQSLVARASRLKRFSEKYRDAIVKRLLDGKLTFSQVRSEQKITEVELTDWISDLFHRMQLKLDEVELSTAEYDSRERETRRVVQAKISNDGGATLAKGMTIEGQSNKPK